MNHEVDQSPSKWAVPSTNRQQAGAHARSCGRCRLGRSLIRSGSPTRRPPPRSPSPSGNPRLARTIALLMKRVPHGSIPVFMIRAFEAATKDKLCCLPGSENHRLREPSLSRKPDGVPVSALASDRAENPIALAESCRRRLLSLSLQHLTATRSMDDPATARARRARRLQGRPRGSRPSS